MKDTSIESRTAMVKVHDIVRKHYPRMQMMSAGWTHDHGKQWEFRGPEKFRWFGQASNAFECRSKGWTAWLKSKGHAA